MAYTNGTVEKKGSYRKVTRSDGSILFWSYEVLIGWNMGDGTPTVTQVNSWGPTTGKHLTWADGGTKEARAARMPWDAFYALHKSLQVGWV